MMFSRVSGKDGFNHFRLRFQEKNNVHDALDKLTLQRVLLRVDKDRCSDEAQARYSEHDSCEWFVRVTEELYARALLAEGVNEEDMPRALECVYTVRSRFLDSYDEDMKECLSQLIHVRYDLTHKQWEQTENSPRSAPDFALYPVDSGAPRPWAAVLSATGDRPLCVLAGSWS